MTSIRLARTALLAVAATLIGLTSFESLRSADQQRSGTLELRPGDHICLIGNTLPDRMQHDGWLETFLHARFPKHEFVIRNLGFSGDEVAGFTGTPDRNRRLRSQDFGTADQWLSGSAPVPKPAKLVTRIGVRDNRFETTGTKADVIFAFFGYNESFAGEAGLPQFKKDYDAFVKHALAMKYNGKSAPRLVLFSPVAFEDHHTPNLPDGVETNKRLELYTAAMAEIAKANNVPFVDLFHPTLTLYPAATQRLTINGVHLNDEGNRQVARIIDGTLFPQGPEMPREPQALERLRQAVLDKNFYWVNRYRVMDGYNVYGSRAFEKYTDRQSNYEDQQRELEILDVKTANRDKRIWAVAQGGYLNVDDSNIPPLIPVKTNRPSFGPGGTNVFIDGDEAIKKMTLAKGLKATLFASEKEFPELAKPVQMQFDAKGRLWVAVWPSYPHWKPTEEMNDKILIFEDTDGDGKADKVTVFADHLNCPTGFDFWNGGVLVAQAPYMMFLKDTKGTGKADVRVRVLDGLDSADSHHTSNSFAMDPGGALYFQEGTFHHSQVETPYGPPARVANGAVFRYEPRAQKFEVYVSTGFANPHGHLWDRWGQDIVWDGTGANPYHGALFSTFINFPDKHPKPPQVYQQRTRPCSGVEMLTSKHFPESMQGNLLVCNVIGDQGILQYKLNDRGSSFAGTEVEKLVMSTDPDFRPSDVKVGPDGAIWFIDWYNPIIGHLQHAIRDPNRDRTHGRIYRITAEGRPPSPPVAIADQPVAKLLDVLKEPEDRVRYRARAELSGRDSQEVIRAAGTWLAGLDKADPNYEHNRLEGLWVYQSQNVVNEGLLREVLRSPDFRARAAATRVLCYWRDRISGTLDLLKTLVADAHPRVRLEAVRASSFLTVPEAIEVPLISAELPTDQYLDFVRTETFRVLDPIVRKALTEGRTINLTSDAGSHYLLRTLTTDDLLKMKRTRGIDAELLFRPGVRDEQRREALSDLAKLDTKSEVRVLLDAIQRQEVTARNPEPTGGRQGGGRGQRGARGAGARGAGPETAGQQPIEESVMFDLVRLLTNRNAGELKAVRSELEAMTAAAPRPLTRQLGYVTLIAADSSVEPAWALAQKSVGALRDLLQAMPLVRDPALRASLYPKVEPLLNGLPQALSAGSSGDAAAIRQAAMMALTSVRGQEEPTFKALARFVRDGADRHAAVQAMLRIPAAYWPKDEARPLLDSIVAYVRATPAQERTMAEVVDALQLGDALTALLPADAAKSIRQELTSLGVRVIRVGTVTDQMLFDKERIVVQAGRQVEFVLENTDLMPHNFVITRPGALQEIGTLAEAQATQPGAQERHYVPPSEKVLLSSRLLAPRETQRLRFTAPAQPGVYPYVCTYPGHWLRMHGALYVVQDLDDYLADPEGYLVRHPLPVADELLKFNRPRKEWTIAELSPSVDQLAGGRSFGNGKQMFQVAACVACHKLGGAGQEFGPDLTKLDPKQQSPAEILRDIVDPSFRINEKYQTWAIETQAGKVITGLIVGETPTEVKVVENPQVSTTPIVLRPADIVKREKAPNSIMPKGLLDKLTMDEILDLIAYVAAGGDVNHKLFQGAHDHGHGGHH